MRAGWKVAKTKLVPGLTDLATLQPELAAEAFGWDPTTVTTGSNKKKEWRCQLGHHWESVVKNRALHHSGCPYCSGSKPWPGFNDLLSKHPEVAAEADGWAPEEVTVGSKQKKAWRCSLGHTWEATVTSRTPPQKSGCPYCAGKAVWPGFNDLATLRPALAKEADGWDPTTVTVGSNKSKDWRCTEGHTWSATVDARTLQHQACPVCANRKVSPGFNDLKTLHPEVAAEADGWDPTTVTPGSKKVAKWKCRQGHTWEVAVHERTPPHTTGCPVCSGRKLLTGVNDLATVDPNLAKEVCGWDPASVHANSHKHQKWRCELGHTWEATVNSRRPPNPNGCPYCAGNKVLPGFNDLATVCSEVAKEAEGWDPTTVTSCSNQKLEWRCKDCGHLWKTQVNARTPPHNTGCPECAESGFKQSLPAWFYLLERPGEQQLGVSNVPEIRLKTHGRNGWQEVEVVGPFPGNKTLETERSLKRWLRERVGLVLGTHENWYTADLEVRSLAELKAKSGVETDLF